MYQRIADWLLIWSYSNSALKISCRYGLLGSILYVCLPCVSEIKFFLITLLFATGSNQVDPELGSGWKRVQAQTLLRDLSWQGHPIASRISCKYSRHARRSGTLTTVTVAVWELSAICRSYVWLHLCSLSIMHSSIMCKICESYSSVWVNMFLGAGRLQL